VHQVDKEANMTDADWQKMALENEIKSQMLLTYLIKIKSEFEKLFPSGLKPGKYKLEEIFEHVIGKAQCVKQERDAANQRAKMLNLTIEEYTKEHASLENFIEKALVLLPSIRNEFHAIPSQQSCSSGLSLILEGIKRIARARDDALKKNLPLQKEINRKDKHFAAEAAALKSSQDGRDEDRAKYAKELEKKESEISAWKQKHSKERNEAVQGKKDSQRIIERLSMVVDEKSRQLGVKDRELGDLTLNFEALFLERDELRNKLDTSLDELTILRKEREPVNVNHLPSSTKRQIEQDRVEKAVEKATKPLMEEIKKLREKNHSLERARQADEKTIRNLSQDKVAMKQTLKELEGKLSAVSEVEEKLEKDLELERARIGSLLEVEETLGESRSEFAHRSLR
jgi:chromosome segregation ATPase